MAADESMQNPFKSQPEREKGEPTAKGKTKLKERLCCFKMIEL